MEVTRKHLQVTTHMYYSATTCAHAMKHLRDLRYTYDGAIRAKRDYHDVVDARLQDEISITHTHQRWQQYVVHTQETYHTAKQDALTSNIDNATTVGPHTRYRQNLHRLRVYENRWLGYTQQIYDHALQVRVRTQRLEIQKHAERTKYGMYNMESSHPRQQLYLHRKRPREIWDPTLWEIPLLPLPKRHKTHWEPHEWEVPWDTETHTH